ncbi:MAG: nucleotide exchange factor GrpE [Syntrophothermus sp.]
MNKDKKNKDKEANTIKIERVSGDKHDDNAENENKGQAEPVNAKPVPEKETAVKIEDHPEFKALKTQNEELQKQVEELKDRMLRKAAEFENYKRRTDVEQSNLLKYAGESVLTKILPVFDDLERSLDHAGEASNIESIVSGLRMIVNKFRKTLEDQGVAKIDAKGKPFDVNFHEALLQQNVPGVAPHTVIEVVEPGYTYKEKVIRHAKVIVSDENSAV